MKQFEGNLKTVARCQLVTSTTSGLFPENLRTRFWQNGSDMTTFVSQQHARSPVCVSNWLRLLKALACSVAKSAIDEGVEVQVEEMMLHVMTV